MTVQPAHAPAPKRSYPAKNLDAITPVFDDPRVDQQVRDEFRLSYARAWATAKAQSSIEPLLALVERWWPEAVFWSDIEAAQRVMAQVDDIMANGLPADRPRYGKEWLADLIERKRQTELHG